MINNYILEIYMVGVLIYVFFAGLKSSAPLPIISSHIKEMIRLKDFEKSLTIDTKFRTKEVEHLIENLNELISAMRLDAIKRINHEQHNHRFAYHDILTGLPNRALLMDRLTQSIVLSERNKTEIAVIFLDIDRFKLINDTMGHSVGDELLCQFGERLTECVRESDTVARLGGDEFVIFLQETGVVGAEIVANSILRAMSVHFSVNEQKISCKTSLGISCYPNDGAAADVLIKNADSAMYKAKKGGRNNYKIFDIATDSMSLSIGALDKDIRKALDNNEFHIEYQPQYDLKSGAKIAGMEALVRWTHPTRGNVSPADFIPLSEETGQIAEIGNYVLTKACQFAIKLEKLGFKIPVSVNVSISQLVSPFFIENLLSVIAKHNLSPKMIELELTESVMIDNADVTLALLHKIKDFGISVAIDDFGTGYSSLTYLKKLPVSKLKIDKAFVDDVDQDSNNIMVIKAIVSLGHLFKMKVVAEGVETQAQLDILKSISCDLIQGYLLSKPITEQQIIALLENERKVSQMEASTDG